MKLQRRPVAVGAIAAAVLCLAVSGFVAWRVERALGGSRIELAQQELLGVETHPLGQLANPGFEGITAPAVFKGAAAFQGRLYLAGPAGLYAYSTAGSLEHIYRTGIDLPAAALGQLTVGMLTGSRQPELLFATAGAGVVAFDGRAFRQILPKQDEARNVTALLPMANGRLLIGTAKLGLLTYDGTTLKRFHATTDNVYVTTLAGTEAELWVGTLNDGLLYWRGGQTERIGEEQGLPDRRVEQIALGQGDYAGRAYVGTPVGVAEVRNGKVARVLAQGAYAHALMTDGDSLLVGQMEAGVIRVSLAGAENDVKARRPIVARVDFDSSPAAGGVQAAEKLNRAVGRGFIPGKRPIESEPALAPEVCSSEFSIDRRPSSAACVARRVDAGGSEVRSAISNQTGDATNLTVEQFFTSGDGRYALAGDGLLEQERDGEWRRMQVAKEVGSQLADGHISALLAASDGRLWVGYFDRGLDILPATGGEAMHVEDEHVFCVNRIVEDSNHGAVAVATANGLVMFDRDGRQKQVLGREAGLIANHVTDVAMYGGGMALATPAGITFLDPSGAHSLYAFQGLVNNHVYALGASGDKLVAGTLGGLSLLAGDAIQRNLTVATSGLKHNWITGLAAVGNDWLVGTYGAGVLRLAADGSVTATDATRNGLVVNPTAIASDGRMVLAGTLGQGLMVGDATGTRWRTITAGLPSLNVTAVAGSNGVVYVGTENGLVKIAENKLL
jgi:ligand-binding sensor domain-containing protein